MKEILLCVCMYVCVSVFLCLPCLCLLYNFSLWFYLCPCVRVIIYTPIRFYRVLSLSLSLSLFPCFSSCHYPSITLFFLCILSLSPSFTLSLSTSISLTYSLSFPSLAISLNNSLYLFPSISHSFELPLITSFIPIFIWYGT